MASPITLYGDALVVSAGWTTPSNAIGATDAASATITSVGSPIELSLADEAGIVYTISVEYGVRWTATTDGGRAQSALVELVDSVGTVHSSFSTPTRNSATLADFTATFTVPVHNGTQVNDYQVRVTPQEGGGMGGALVQYVDSVYAIVTYSDIPLGGQARVMFIGL